MSTIQKSIIIRDLQASPQLRTRAEALLRAHLWSDANADPRQPLPMDDVMWCVASNASLQQQVRNILDDPDNPNPNMTFPAIDQINDNDLEYVVLAVAWARLNPVATPE